MNETKKCLLFVASKFGTLNLFQIWCFETGKRDYFNH